MGLRAFGEDDADYFFGRQRETRIVTSNLRTARLTIVYAASGVGKSSLVRAGVAHELRARGAQVVSVVDDWTTDPIAAVVTGVSEALQTAGLPVAPGAEDRRLDEFFTLVAPESPRPDPLLQPDSEHDLQAAQADRREPVLVILDQFEHYLLYGPGGERADSFEDQFARCVNRRDCPVHMLVVVREDALAKLDRLSGRIPSLFNNTLRIQPLDRRAAEDAIKLPLGVYNRQHADRPPLRIEEALVERLLAEVHPGQRLAVQVGRDRPPGTEQPDPTASVEVEAPYLQLVLTRLWEAEVGSGSPVLRDQTLTAMGGARRILKDHLDQQMRKLDANQREIAARVFRFLVTPSGGSNAFSAADLAEYGEVPLKEVEPVLARLSANDVRILRQVGGSGPQAPTRYEVFFEVLAAAALSWRSRYIALPGFRWTTLAPLCTVLLVGILAEVALVAGMLPAGDWLFLTRGATLLVMSALMLVQIYRWFLRFVSMTGFLSIRTYRSPLIGVVLAALLWLLTYVGTRIRLPDGTRLPFDPGWIADVTTASYIQYALTVLLTWAVGALAMAFMQLAGQLTARRFRSFDVGLYAAFGTFVVLLLLLIVASLDFNVELVSVRAARSP